MFAFYDSLSSLQGFYVVCYALLFNFVIHFTGFVVNFFFEILFVKGIRERPNPPFSFAQFLAERLFKK